MTRTVLQGNLESFQHLGEHQGGIRNPADVVHGFLSEIELCRMCGINEAPAPGEPCSECYDDAN